jgi:2-methylcitrate dehydratase PrpD
MEGSLGVSQETSRLSAYVHGLRFGELPTDVITTAKLAIRDIVGVGMFASTLPWSRIVADVAAESSGAGPCTIWGRSARLSAPFAALSNGAAAHGIEMDDRSRLLEIHNGAATVPAAVALAEHVGASGRDLILSVVCGYEVAFRVARACKGGLWPRFYPDGLLGVFGAAAAAGKLLQLSADQLTHALGIAATMASGSWEFTADPSATMVKRLQGGGWSAYSGVTAALLALRGFTAPMAMIDGKLGFCRSFCTEADPDIEALSRNLGSDFQIRLWETKPYAARGSYSSAIDAMIDLRNEVGFSPDDIDSVTVGCSSRIFPNAGGPRPTSVMAAQYHLPFVLAASILHDPRNPSIWTEDVLTDPATTDLLVRITVEVDPDADALYRNARNPSAARVTVTLRDGRVHSRLVEHGTGTAEKPLTSGQVRDKFLLLAGAVVVPSTLASIDLHLDQLEEHSELAFLRMFGKMAS